MNAARAAIVALLMGWAAAAFADVAVPPLTGRVVDLTGTLTSGDIAALTQTLSDLETRKGSQVAVLIVPTTQPEAIEQYSIRVAEAWKIGRKKIDDGALLVIARDDRKLRIEVGYGLEGALNDVTAKRIIDEVITPRFRAGDFAGGMSAGVARIIGVIDGEPLPAPVRPPQQQRQSSVPLDFVNPLNPFFIIPVLLLGGGLRRALGRLLGAGATGGLVMLLTWYVFTSLRLGILVGLVAAVYAMFSDALTAPMPAVRGTGGRRSSGGGGGWFGGRSSGSSSGSGSFSGGGGSFGGGGASGSW